MKSFLKKQEVPKETVTKTVVFDKKNDVFFANPEKYDRARNILDLILGIKAPRDANEVERKDHYAKALAIQNIEPSSEIALPALYELLGGLIRTPSEQKEAEKKAQEMQRKGKKRMIQ